MGSTAEEASTALGEFSTDKPLASVLSTTRAVLLSSQRFGPAFLSLRELTLPS